MELWTDAMSEIYLSGFIFTVMASQRDTWLVSLTSVKTTVCFPSTTVEDQSKCDQFPCAESVDATRDAIMTVQLLLIYIRRSSRAIDDVEDANFFPLNLEKNSLKWCHNDVKDMLLGHSGAMCNAGGLFSAFLLTLKKMRNNDTLRSFLSVAPPLITQMASLVLLACHSRKVKAIYQQSVKHLAVSAKLSFRADVRQKTFHAFQDFNGV